MIAGTYAGRYTGTLKASDSSTKCDDGLVLDAGQLETARSNTFKSVLPLGPAGVASVDPLFTAQRSSDGGEVIEENHEEGEVPDEVMTHYGGEGDEDDAEARLAKRLNAKV